MPHPYTTTIPQHEIQFSIHRAVDGTLFQRLFRSKRHVISHRFDFRSERERDAARPLVMGPLSLAGAVEIALENSPRLRGAQADIDIAIAQVRTARAARKPSVSATTFLTGGSENGPIYNSPDGVSPQNLFAAPRGAFETSAITFSRSSA